MPSTATITAFYTFSALTQIKSSEHNANFNNFRGHLIAIDPNTATAAATLTYDLGASDKYWRVGYVGLVNANTVSASSIVGTTVTATTLIATTISATTIVASGSISAAGVYATTISASSIVGTTITATSLVSTSINATTINTTSLTVSSAINLSGGQIAFPASQNASADVNTLDDYEEGTFNPTVYGSSSSGTSTYVLQQGSYVKIGQVVWFTATVQISNQTGTGNIRFGGLPFTSIASIDETVACVPQSLTYSNQITAQVLASNTIMRFLTVSTGASAAEVALDTAFIVNITGVYRTTA
jgi:hypothetical protein